MTSPNRNIAVFGAAGHTGRFVVAELRRRGWTPIRSGRDASKLGSEGDVRPATIDDPASLDRALEGAVAVINCAGPFVDTAPAVVAAALRAGIHYLDVTAEQVAAMATLSGFAEPARAAGVVVAPAMGFYGGLGDLLATSAMGDWPSADEIRIGFALDGWKPTPGTRATIERNAGRRFVFTNNRLEVPPETPARARWEFPPPLGAQEVVSISTVDAVTISHHLRVPEIRTFMNLAPLDDLRDPRTPGPVAADASGRSAQTFVVEAVVRRGARERRASARGRDIYAVTAPIVVEAAARILDGAAPGAATAGELFDAAELLRALSGELGCCFLPADGEAGAWSSSC